MKTTDLIESARRALNAGDFAGSLAAINALESALSPVSFVPVSGANTLGQGALTKRPGTRRAKVAICVGHSRQGDKGAESVNGVTEWTYNRDVAEYLFTELGKRGIDSKIFHRYAGLDYPSAMKWLAAQVKDYGADCALELHFNSAGAMASGFEVLCFDPRKDIPSTRFAKSVLDKMAKAWPEGRNRNVKWAERGRLFIESLPCPAIIVEPFFGSNTSDWERWKNAQAELAGIYADGVQDWMLTLAK
jgi:N-acetylmuramoyl-L-alanine amidase